MTNGTSIHGYLLSFFHFNSRKGSLLCTILSNSDEIGISYKDSCKYDSSTFVHFKADKAYTKICSIQIMETRNLEEYTALWPLHTIGDFLQI